MYSVKKTSRGTYELPLYLRENEVKTLRKLQEEFNLGSFETVKHCLELVYWWSQGEIEHEELG